MFILFSCGVSDSISDVINLTAVDKVDFAPGNKALPPYWNLSFGSSGPDGETGIESGNCTRLDLLSAGFDPFLGTVPSSGLRSDTGILLVQSHGVLLLLQCAPNISNDEWPKGWKSRVNIINLFESIRVVIFFDCSILLT